MPHPESYTAYAFFEKDGDLKKLTVDWKDPQPDEVIVKVKACGVCAGSSLTNSDVLPQTQTLMKTALPRIPGHEFAGEVVAVGSNVTLYKIGQAVGGGWGAGCCLKCDACRSGKFVACQLHIAHGTSVDGGYAEYVTVREEGVVRIPDGMAPEIAGPLMCAGVTVFNSLRQMNLAPNDIVAIQGIGGLGHLAIQFAVKMGYRAVALSSGPSKEKDSLQLGAFAYLDASKVNQAEELAKLGGAKTIMLCAPTSDVGSLLGGLAYDGILCVLAAALTPTPIHLFSLVPKRLSIRGFPAGGPKDYEECLEFAHNFGVKPLVQTFPLEKSAEAYAHRSTARYRAVIVTE
ncbi:hypothetical protein EIP91_009243 [Steccherinum ochraceum]|uniref:Enoyl reductase (ER) domain-containing protein n=1 Tax=Steccherinum ochraceum TaxID=92696 RepID=A0A4R0RBN4_9APHY|nr:hypothetical protein EIP91_009243 [Steccherinum ochraceum]